MKFALITLAALALGGVAYAASPATRPTAGGSCCGMDMSNTKVDMSNMKMDMSCGSGCMMGTKAPSTQPAPSAPTPHAQ